MVETIRTSKPDDIKPYIKKLFIPLSGSHKGQNGKLLIVGGSHLFHAASLWSAETASHFVDMVHYASTEENNEIMLSLKKLFKNGMVVSRSEIESYIAEDDAVLLGPGLDRSAETKELTERIIKSHNTKKFVIDAGSLQMIDPHVLTSLKETPIITPHQKEFEQLFNEPIVKLTTRQIVDLVQMKAAEFNCVILLKAVVDIVSDGKESYVIEGGNQGLTKGGTGDILAGLTASLYTKNNAVVSSVLASFILKRTADELFSQKGYWYNNTDIISTIPNIVNKIFL